MIKRVGRKAVQRKRKMKYFIDATDEIIQREGTSAVTIRGVGDIAGFNSATLYNYFKNVEHLIYYSHMKYILELDEIVDQIYIKETDSSNRLKNLWSKFCEYTYHNVDAIYSLMLSDFSLEFNDVLHDYMSIYTSDNIGIAACDRNKYFRNSVFDIISDGIVNFGSEHDLSIDTVKELEEFVFTFFQGQLSMLKTIDNGLDFEIYHTKMNRFLEYLMWTHLIVQE